MLGNTLKNTMWAIGVGAFVTLFAIVSPSVFAENPLPSDLDTQVNIGESLSVSVTTPETWAEGDTGTFLRNKLTLNVFTNNPHGFTATMTTLTDDTHLLHNALDLGDGTSIPTLDSTWTRTQPGSNFWGYSVDDAEETGIYSPLVGASATPITLISREESTREVDPVNSLDIYFGAKANADKIAGTYTGTVVISVVSGIVSPEDSSVPPVTPKSNPGASEPNANPSYSSTYNRTAYTTTTTDSDAGTTTTTTTIDEGDTRNSYQDPHGTKRSTEPATTATNSALIAALAAGTVVSAGAGALFLILAKRKKDDDEEE